MYNMSVHVSFKLFVGLAGNFVSSFYVPHELLHERLLLGGATVWTSPTTRYAEFNYQLALWRHEVKRTYLRSLRTVRKNGACSIHDIGWKIRFRYTCR